MFLEDCILEILCEYLNNDNKYLKNALQILDYDNIKDFINQNQNLTSENTIDLTSLERFLSTYPKTKKIMDNIKTIIIINTILKTSDKYQFKIPTNFLEYQFTDDEINNTLLNNPINQIKPTDISFYPIGQLLLKYILTNTMVELFKKLNLKPQYMAEYVVKLVDEYDNEYDDESKFFNSDKSFIEIYNELSELKKNTKILYLFSE